MIITLLVGLGLLTLLCTLIFVLTALYAARGSPDVNGDPENDSQGPL